MLGLAALPCNVIWASDQLPISVADWFESVTETGPLISVTYVFGWKMLATVVNDFALMIMVDCSDIATVACSAVQVTSTCKGKPPTLREPQL